MTKLEYRAATHADPFSTIAVYNSTAPFGQATVDLRPVSVESRHAWLDAQTVGRQLDAQA